jgi:hypothetical protein
MPLQLPRPPPRRPSGDAGCSPEVEVSLEGALAVRLTVAKERVVEVELSSTRPVQVASVLAGRTADEVLRLVPLLFPVCGVAHGVACARALEASRAAEEDLRLDAARALVALAEAAVSHAWQLAIAWPEAAGVAVDAGALRAAREARVALSEALFGCTTLGPALLPRPALDAASLAVTALCSLVDELATGSNALLDAVAGAGRQAFGATTASCLASLDALDVGETAMQLAAGPLFAAQPTQGGATLDLSAYARQRGDEEVRACEAEHGRGLLTRLIARRTDARADARRLASRTSELLVASQGEAARRRAIEGGGAGSADTARGPLVYWARAATGATVKDVRVVAPTDWTFHPRGVVRGALLGAEATPTLARDAGWLMLALDPCVAWTIEVRRA